MMKILILALLVGNLADGSGPPISPQDLDILRAVTDAAQENHAKFPHGSVTFRRQSGFCDNFDQAKAGNLRDRHEAACVYTWDGSRALYEQRFPLASMAAATTWSSAFSSNSWLSSFRVATNGKLTLIEAISANRAGDDFNYGRVITGGSERFAEHAQFPLGIGCPEATRIDFAANIGALARGSEKRAFVTIDSDATLDGVKVVKIVIRFQGSRSTFWVDLDRGAIPILHVYEPGTGTTTFESLGRIEPVANHGWLPLEMTYYVAGSGASANRLVIDRYIFDEKPEPSAFVMTFPKPITIGNEANGMGYNSPQKAWDLDNLPSDTAPGVHPLRKAPAKPSLAASLPGERRPRPRYWTIAAASIAAVVVAAGIWRWRNSRAA